MIKPLTFIHAVLRKSHSREDENKTSCLENANNLRGISISRDAGELKYHISWGMRRQAYSTFTLMLLVAIVATHKMMQKTYKMFETLAHVYSSESTWLELMNTKMRGLRYFLKICVTLCFGQKYPEHWKG